MDFAHRLAVTRKQRGMSRQGLANAIGVHLSQVRRYEAGTYQPTLDVRKRIAAIEAPAPTNTTSFRSR